MITIQGECAPGFEPVREAFRENFTKRGEVGAAVALIVHGEPLVDLWTGWADHARTKPWQADTIVNVYSATKGMTALCAHILADRGLLDFDAPVTRYWPEFAQAGKDRIRVRSLLSHQAGLPVVDAELPAGGALDWDTMVHALEAQEPVWEPGTRQGYHALTFGWLVGEVVRRISARSVGTFFRTEVAAPLGLDFFIGMPAAEDRRVAEMIPVGPAQPQRDPASLAARALALMSGPAGADVNSREWRAAEVPAANGHGNARALSRVYGALARGGELEGVRLLSPAAIDIAAAEQCTGIDAVLGMEARRSLGFILNTPGGRYAWGPNPGTFGHSGAGGSLGFADPDEQLGFGYTINAMSAGVGADPRWAPLIDAVYGSL